MAQAMQKFTIVGRVGFIDELSTVKAGRENMNVLHFTVAVKHSREIAHDEDPKEGETIYESPNGKDYAESTMWVRCTLWNGYAEAMDRNLLVGDLVMVEGQLAYDLVTGGPNTYTTREGLPGARFELNQVDVNILAHTNGGDLAVAEDEDIPWDEEDAIEEEAPAAPTRRASNRQAVKDAPAPRLNGTGRQTRQAALTTRQAQNRRQAASNRGQNRTQATRQASGTRRASSQRRTRRGF